MPAPLCALVAGDIVVDRHIYEGERLNLRDQSKRGTHWVEEAGGAALTQRLIEAVFAADVAERRRVWRAKRERKDPAPMASVCRLGCRLPQGAGRRRSPEWLVGAAAWRPYPKSGTKDLYWRVSKAIGYGSPREREAPGAAAANAATVLRPADNLPSHHDVLVLDDAGDRFRHKEHANLWQLPDDPGARPAWIVLKLAGPIGRGDLWDRLMACEPRQRLIVLVPAPLLRRDDIRLSLGLSSERTVEHLVNGLRQNPLIQPLRQARHLIVSFEGDGAVWIHFSKPDQPARIVFDAAHSEGEWSSRIEGEAFGFQTCLAASVVQTLASKRKDTEPEFQSAIECGLSAMRTLRDEGHGVAVSTQGTDLSKKGFQEERLANEILHPSHRFVRAAVPAQAADLSTWSILASLQNPSAPARALFGFARQLVIQGDAVLDHVPHLRVGKLLTADRDEMETLRSLRRIMVAYRDSNFGKKPLSIGVFGSPGSGKSFGVEQLAVGVFGQADAKSYEGWMEFNLSQFDGPTDLIGAFHQVRDRVLQGFVPVVFWDEFDSKDYAWLQFLLAPMQDGRFQEDQVTHTLGKCVFVFAGGTAETFDGFGPKKEEPAYTEFKLAKGPDFKSRLDGYLNVLGPNSSGTNDVFYPVRRALIGHPRGVEKDRGAGRLEAEIRHAIRGTPARYQTLQRGGGSAHSGHPRAGRPEGRDRGRDCRGRDGGERSTATPYRAACRGGA